MCGSVNGGGAAIKAAVAAPTPPPAAPPASSGCGGGGGGTQLAPALPAPTTSLDRLIQQAAQQRPPSPAQVAPPVAGGGGAFAQAEATVMQTSFGAYTDGAGTLAGLRSVAAARSARVDKLAAGVAQDAQQSGAQNPVDVQKVQLERDNLAQINAIIERLAPLATTIDAAEHASIKRVVDDANRTGAFDPVELARTMIQIQGSAANVPASYMASANRAQDLAATLRARIVAVSNATSATANQTGAFDPVKLQEVSLLSRQQTELGVALKANFDQARTNPAAAQAKLDAALQSTDIATVIAALA